MLKNLLYLSGFSTFVVIVIVGMNIYRNLNISNLKPTTQTRIVPIPTGFDTSTLKVLRNKKQITIDLNEKSSVISVDTQNINESIKQQSKEGGETTDKEKTASVSATPTIQP